MHISGTAVTREGIRDRLLEVSRRPNGGSECQALGFRPFRESPRMYLCCGVSINTWQKISWGEVAGGLHLTVSGPRLPRLSAEAARDPASDPAGHRLPNRAPHTNTRWRTLHRIAHRAPKKFLGSVSSFYQNGPPAPSHSSLTTG